MAGILKYFKPVPTPSSSSPNLPDPDGPLNRKIPAKAIDIANAKVTEATKVPRGRSPYFYLTPGQRYEVGKRTAEHGVTATLRYYAEKYLKLPLKETTARRLKDLYKDTLKPKAKSKKAKPKDEGSDVASENSDEEPTKETEPEEVKELPRKKTGRPLLLGADIDTQVQEYIKDVRRRGLAVNTSVVIGSAQGILLYKDANLLADNEKGAEIELSKDWAKYLLKRMGFVKRKACSKAKVDVEWFKEVKEDFLLDVKNIVAMDDIPAELVINFDQTALNYVPVTPWTMEKQGAKRVEVVAKDDKRQITAVLAGSMSGDFLPPQLIYEVKTTRCLPQYKFPSSWHITHSDNHWSNEFTMKEYVEKILVPYINRKRAELNLSSNQPALLIFDNFKAQTTSSMLKLLDSYTINVALLPANCTDRLQPLDLSVNKAAKDFLHSRFQDWYAKQLCSQLQKESEMQAVDLKLSTVKPLSAEWIESMYNYFKTKPEIIKNGFKEAGITNCLTSADSVAPKHCL